MIKSVCSKINGGLVTHSLGLYEAHIVVLGIYQRVLVHDMVLGLICMSNVNNFPQPMYLQAYRS